MAYRFERADGSVEHAVRRIAREQLGHAIESIRDESTGRDKAVHDVRKACKKVRALLRLVHPVLPAYGEENPALRQVARIVSPVRDAAVLIDTYDDLVPACQERLGDHVLGAARDQLVAERDRATGATDPAAALARCREPLEEAMARAAGWSVEKNGFAAIRGGLRATVKRARNAMRDAQEDREAATVHAWRKRCKDHWYHARLLEPIWPGPMKAHVKAARALAEALGDHHDLAVLIATITVASERFGGDAGVEILVDAAECRQEALAEHAFAVGKRLFAERPSALARRWKAYHHVWRREPEHEASLLGRGT